MPSKVMVVLAFLELVQKWIQRQFGIYFQVAHPVGDAKSTTPIRVVNTVNRPSVRDSEWTSVSAKLNHLPV